LPESGAASAQDELQDQLDASQKALHGLRQELRQIRDLLQHAGIALDHAHAGQQLSVAERDRFMEQLATASAERDRFREELDRVTAELDSASGKAAEMIAGLEQEKATVKRVTALHAQRQELVRSLSGERDELRGELARRDEKLLQLQDRIRNMDDANGALQRQLAERDAQIVALDTRIDAADGALDTARSEMTESRRQIGDIRAQYQTCEEQLAKLNAELEQQGSTAGQQAAAVATGEKLQAELTACQAELDQAQAGRVTAQQLSNPQTSAAAPGSVATALADADGDGTSDETDLCPGTAAGVATGPAGCALDAPVTLKGVNFHYDSHELTSESHAVLDRVASILRHHPVLRLEVAGHTDTQGDPVYNLWLSQQRATTVRDYLIQQQVNPDNLTAQGYGSQQPVADNTTREGLARNRRVELRRLP
jgi:outer membrane protein OmpA-like peptidoglycan-associated protein